LNVIWKAINYVVKNASNYIIAEVGSYKGGSAYFIAQSFKSLLGKEIMMYAIDTFEGHPDKLTVYDIFQENGKFSDTNYDEVLKYLCAFYEVDIIRGEFSEVIKGIPDARYGFVHIDVDTYKSTLKCLEYYGEKLVHNGIILVDDYGSPTCLGVKKAVNDYLRESQRKHTVCSGMLTKQVFLIG
jgi:hypothetical protein